MFIILLSYKKPLEMVEQYLTVHRSFLDECYQKNYFVVSGFKKPRTGGVIISQLNDREKLEKLISKDPFHLHDIADYEIIEFTPTKYHQEFSNFIDNL